jgi:hypothetical protein
MNCSFRSLLAFVLASSACLAAVSNQHPEASVCIRIYDLPHVPRKTISLATIQTEKIFRRAGIRIVWEEPPTDALEAHWLDLGNSSPARLTSSDRPCLVLRLIQPTPAVILPGALGFAVPLGRSGIHVELFWDRIKSEARQMGVDPILVLAYAMAHEVGHVLLRSSPHSRAGIMQGRWDTETWRLVSFGMLAFLPEEAATMRANCRPVEIRASNSVDLYEGGLMITGLNAQ